MEQLVVQDVGRVYRSMHVDVPLPKHRLRLFLAGRTVRRYLQREREGGVGTSRDASIGWSSAGKLEVRMRPPRPGCSEGRSPRILGGREDSVFRDILQQNLLLGILLSLRTPWPTKYSIWVPDEIVISRALYYVGQEGR